MMTRRIFLVGCLLILDGAIAAAALKWVSVPWATILALLLLNCVLAVLAIQSFHWKAVWLNGGIAAAALVVLELFTASVGGGFFKTDSCGTSDQSETSDGASLSIADGDLGYAAQAGVVAHSRLSRRDGRLIYDATYTIGPDRLRKSAETPTDSQHPLVVFGCSFAFGIGVNDNQTVAARLQAISGGVYRTHNFGFPGYGPHQMLRAIESGVVGNRLGGGSDALAIYEAIPDHVERANGKYPYITWDTAGPRYTLDAKGTPTFAGPFVRSVTIRRIVNQVFKSFLVKAITRNVQHRTDTDRERFVAIVVRAADEWRRRFGRDLIVVFWGGQDSELLARSLRSRGLTVVETREIFGDDNDRRQEWRLDECDSHPSAAANEAVSRYLFERVLPSDR